MPRRTPPSEIRSILDKHSANPPAPTPAVEPEQQTEEQEREQEEAPSLIAEVVKNKGVITAAMLKGGPVELPTGITVVIERAQLLSLAAAGKIPNSLLGIAARAAKSPDLALIGGKDKDGESDDDNELSAEEKAQKDAENEVEMERLINSVVCAVVTEPHIVLTEEEEEEDSVWVGRLHPMDKQAIYFYAQHPQSSWDRFRSLG